MFLFNKREVYIGYKMDEFSLVRSALETEGIKYWYDVVDHFANNGDRGRFGSAGINLEYQIQYTVSVKADNYEKAQYLVNSALHPLRP